MKSRFTLLLCFACHMQNGPATFAGDQLIATGSVWSYLDNGSDQGTVWRNPAFDDSAWTTGPAQLGYGDGDEQTVVSFGGNSNNKYITTYFRHTFSVADPNAYQAIEVRVLRDDGAVAYINGVEALRTNMPSGTIDSLTLASSTVGGAEESAFQQFFVPVEMLNVGENVIAVEIHQRSATSSDISFDLEMIGDDGTPSLRRGPYIQRTTPDSTVVRWRTGIPADSVVRFGDAPDNLDQSVTINTPTTEHEVALSGLDPSTIYYYAIESNGTQLAGADADHRFTTSPPTGTFQPTSVWVLGDSGTANGNARAVRDAYYNYAGTDLADLWIMLGDNAYTDGTDSEYQAAVFDMYPTMLRRAALWPTLGNHDGHTSNSSDESGPYYDSFTLPRAGEAGGVPSGTEAYYSFDYANIHFVCLESFETDRSVNGPMLTWLQADLDATDQPWIIAFWHHPPYSKGSHNSDSSTEMIQMRENALPILEATGVDLVLAGHSHSYERSFLLDGHYDTSDTLDPETMILDSGDGSPGGDGAYSKTDLAHRGAVYAVAGSSGKTSNGPLNHPAMYVSLRRLGSMVLEIDGNRLDAAFLSGTGGIDDAFTIIKTLCPVDINNDGIVNTQDMLEFLNLWSAADPRADWNNDGTVNTQDVLAYLNSWAAGC